MRIKELLQKYVCKGIALNFESLYLLAEAKGYYTNTIDFEIDLERAISEGLVGCATIQDENRFFVI